MSGGNKGVVYKGDPMAGGMRVVAMGAEEPQVPDYGRGAYPRPLTVCSYGTCVCIRGGSG
jgi:hypothetical protein